MPLGVIPTARKSQRKGRGAELELSRILQGYGYDVNSCGLMTGWNRQSGTLCGLVTASPLCSSAATDSPGW